VPAVAGTSPDKQQERERRAAAARRRYHENPEEERERCRLRKQRQRAAFQSAVAPAFLPRVPRGKYDPADYAEEWEFLTRTWRMKARDIIQNSAPGYDWFAEHVLPLVRRSVCTTCDMTFNPQEAGSLVRCSQVCGFTRMPATKTPGNTR
jgi:hypothetical protein